MPEKGMRSMKVGVITFHNAHNFGASLQTWALQKVLKNYGLETYVIHYHPPVIDNLYDPIKMTGLKRPFRIIQLRFTKKKSIKRYLNYNRFIKENFNLIGDFTTYEQLAKASLKLDAYITGSDQVWNYQHIGGFDPAYFLDFAEKEALKISYAASIGQNFILPKYRDEIRNSLTDYHALSVREQSAIPVIQELADIEVEAAIDPTLLLTKQDYELIKVKPNIKFKYVFVYMMEDSKDMVTFANRVSRALGYPIIQRRLVKKFKNEIGTCYTQTPGEFLGLIEDAEIVLTNSFHGAVFSIIYEKPFISLLHSDTGSRTIDLLNSLNLSSHIVYDINEFFDMKRAYLEETDKLRKTIEHLKESSLNFLENALEISDGAQRIESPVKIRKNQCYGCFACKEICKVNAITMADDNEGFKYPVVDTGKCIHCGACSKVCIRKNPHLVQFGQGYPKVYAAVNLNVEIKAGSSSGGVFPELARYVIEEKGYVIGVKFNEAMRAVSSIAENMEQVREFYGSKYVKSDFDGMFPKVKELLQTGKLVLYTGLPCECAGLRSYLMKDYENLIIAELICHSAPSPKVFQKYLDSLGEKFKARITKIEFRDKSKGWETYQSSMLIHFDNRKELKVNLRKNNYFRAFTNDLISRPVCCYCNYTYKKRAGDFTIGDFWNIKTIAPEMYDNKGCSAVLLNNLKALKVWNRISDKFKYKETDLWSAFKYNHSKPSKYKVERRSVFDKIDIKPIDDILLRLNDLKNNEK